MADPVRQPQRQGERRLPMALAVLAAAALDLMIPSDFTIAEATRLAYPTILVLLLLLLVLGDPGRIDRERPWLRVTTGVMIGIITASIAASAVRLVAGLLDHADFDSPGQLLSLGAAVWATNVIAFALWYWHLDSGGPVARARGTGTVLPAFRFPEHDIDSLVEAGWYPQFVDYLALSFNTATAFSPTDVSAIRHWSKLWLIAESAISLVLAALVIARAVNVL
ncbi:hypothetical protein [Nocardioides sp.]|uniref:hypothetical protein n=1 Tax=Nocardioides sp. TaxID=35761 RepID=UPI00378476E6